MAYSTFCQTPNNAQLEPMFMGQPVNVARYDVQKYEVFEKLIEKQLSFSGAQKKLTSAKTKLITMHYQSMRNTFSSQT